MWDAFRDPTLIRRWFGWDDEGLEDEIRTIFVDGTVASEDDRTLHIGGHLFTLDDHGPQTVVRVTRAAPVDANDGMDWAAAYDDVDEGWLSFLQQLRFVLARHPRPDDTRRTLYRSGEPLGPGLSPAAELLGLAGLGPAGRYTATTAVADVITGEVWFRSERQLGLTVDGWGDGFLLLAQSPSVPGAASLSLCTYGLEPSAVVELEDRWARWWNGHFKSAG